MERAQHLKYMTIFVTKYAQNVKLHDMKTYLKTTINEIIKTHVTYDDNDIIIICTYH